MSRRTRVAFILLSATFFMLLVDFSIVSIALPSIETELHLSPARGQWIVSTYAIFIAGFLMLTGRCADLYGRYRFFVMGLLVFTFGSLLGGLAHDGTFLIAMRAVQGLGAAIVNPAALAIVLSMFAPGAARARAIAAWGTIGSSGVAAGMLFGGILVQYLGWRAVFFVNVPVAICILVATPFFVARDAPPAARPKLDVVGALLLTSALVTLVYTIESIPQDGWAATTTWAGLLITAALFGLFVVSQRRAAEPILPARLFRYPDLLSGAAVVMLQPMSYAGVLIFLSMYLQRVAGYGALQAGLAFLPSSLIVAFVASPLTMPIARAIGIRALGITAAAVMTAGEAALLFLQPHGTYWAIVLPSTVIGGFGGMLAYQSGMIAGLGHVDDADEGSASATLSFALQLGIGLGVALCAAAQIFRSKALAAAGADSMTALAGGLQSAFLVCVLLGLATLAATLGLRHAASAEFPLRHLVAFGKLHRRSMTDS